MPRKARPNPKYSAGFRPGSSTEPQDLQPLSEDFTYSTMKRLRPISGIGLQSESLATGAQEQPPATPYSSSMKETASLVLSYTAMCERWETVERLRFGHLALDSQDGAIFQLPVSILFSWDYGTCGFGPSFGEPYRSTAHVIDVVTGSRVRSPVWCRKPEMSSMRPGRVEERRRESCAATYLRFHSPDGRPPHLHLFQ